MLIAEEYRLSLFTLTFELQPSSSGFKSDLFHLNTSYYTIVVLPGQVANTGPDWVYWLSHLRCDNKTVSVKFPLKSVQITRICAWGISFSTAT